MLRGEIRRYRPVLQRPGQPLLRLVLSADHLNSDPDRRLVIAAHVAEDDAGSLLHVPVGQPDRWARVPTLAPTRRGRLDELVGQATPEQMTEVDAALGALLELG